MGAVAEGSVQVLDLSIIKALGVSSEDIQEVAAEGRKDLEARERLYRAGRPPLELEGKTILLVDDGIATGCSILAAIAAIRRRSAARVVVAVPVAPASGCSAIRMEADEVISVANRKCSWRSRSGIGISLRSAMTMCSGCWKTL